MGCVSVSAAGGLLNLGWSRCSVEGEGRWGGGLLPVPDDGMCTTEMNKGRVGCKDGWQGGG